jgi:hypothetical protein
MTPHTTTLGSIHRVTSVRVTARTEWLRVAAAYVLPTLATGAGCWLALTAAARVLAAFSAATPPH